eukprot:scaffold2697_cov346-Pavlova_lutheri.AAC.8
MHLVLHSSMLHKDQLVPYIPSRATNLLPSLGFGIYSPNWVDPCARVFGFVAIGLERLSGDGGSIASHVADVVMGLEQMQVGRRCRCSSCKNGPPAQSRALLVVRFQRDRREHVSLGPPLTNVFFLLLRG